jgi:uncharacterized protein (TIGR01777 family)
VKIVIAGGSDQLGTLLARARHTAGDDVVVLSRTPYRAPWRVAEWDAQTDGPWAAELDGAGVVVNVAGRSVNCRYTAQNRREIMASRVDSTRAVGAAIARAAVPPKLWLQASTATIYAHRYDAANDEDTGIIGGAEPDVPQTWNFSIEVAKAWERAMDDAPAPATRKVKLRAAVVMIPNSGGAFDTLRRLVRLGAGGRAGDGRQYVSWIHDADFVRALDWIVRDESLTDAVNVTAPNPLTNDAFMRELRAACGMPIGIPAPGPLLELAAFVLRTETELLLKSRRVVPGKLTASGFTFDYPNWREAACELCARSRAIRRL